MADGAATALNGLDAHLSRPVEQVSADLESFAALLRKWQPAQNLVSRETLDALWARHMRDSLQILQHLTGRERQFLDIGSGGGFPALPLAIALKGQDCQFILIEANQRKCAFLRTVARELNLTVKVVNARAETVESGEITPSDLITSRATAPLGLLLGLMAPFAGAGARLLLHKGREYGEELAEADADWDMDVVVLPSLVDTQGVLLDITNLKPKSV